MRQHKIVMLNGPAGSGKDTAAWALERKLNARHYKMAWPLKRAVQSFLGLSHDRYKEYFETSAKDKPSEQFGGKSPRSILISLSEDWAKRNLSPDIFGILAWNYISTPTDKLFTVISDTGFREECLPIVRGIGRSHVFVIQLSRPGCTYEGDSRSYVDLSDLGVTTTEIHNNHSQEIFEMQIVQTVEKWLAPQR